MAQASQNSTSPNSEGLFSDPQLLMVHRLESTLPQIVIPEGYALRKASLEDAEPLASTLLASFGMDWNVAKVRAELLDHPDVPTTWLIACEGEVVATASYQLKPVDFPDAGWVHWVGARAEHSGRKLGTVVTLAVLHEAVSDGKREVRLTTDDWRLPAIASYLKLGFEPLSWHESHEARWETVLAKLGERG